MRGPSSTPPGGRACKPHRRSRSNHAGARAANCPQPSSRRTVWSSCDIDERGLLGGGPHSQDDATEIEHFGASKSTVAHLRGVAPCVPLAQCVRSKLGNRAAPRIVNELAFSHSMLMLLDGQEMFAFAEWQLAQLQ